MAGPKLLYLCVPLRRVSLTSMFLGGGGGNRSTRRKPTQTWEEHTNSKQKGPGRIFLL